MPCWKVKVCLRVLADMMVTVLRHENVRQVMGSREAAAAAAHSFFRWRRFLRGFSDSRKWSASSRNSDRSSSQPWRSTGAH